jgi:hypothetical protein
MSDAFYLEANAAGEIQVSLEPAGPRGYAVRLLGTVADEASLPVASALDPMIGDCYVLEDTGWLWTRLQQMVDYSWTPVCFFKGNTGPAGADGREIEMDIIGGDIAWRYVQEGTGGWHGLVSVASLIGAQGPQGIPGEDGIEIELSIENGWIVWRYLTDLLWTNLIEVSTLVGPAGDNGTDGRQVEISTSAGYIVWRYVGDTPWNNIVSLVSITGPAGANGVAGKTAYQSAIDGGFVGTELTFNSYLASIGDIGAVLDAM